LKLSVVPAISLKIVLSSISRRALLFSRVTETVSQKHSFERKLLEKRENREERKRGYR